MNTADILMKELGRATGLTGLDLEVYIQVGFEGGSIDPQPRDVPKILAKIKEMRNDLVIFKDKKEKRKHEVSLSLADAIRGLLKRPNEPTEDEILQVLIRLESEKFVHCLSDGRWVRSKKVLAV